MSTEHSRADKPNDATDASLLKATHLAGGTIAVYDEAEAGEWIEIDAEDCIDEQVWA